MYTHRSSVLFRAKLRVRAVAGEVDDPGSVLPMLAWVAGLMTQVALSD